MSPRLSSALTLEHVLLALLDRKPLHGYEIYQELCEMKGISLFWNIKQALLYAKLDKLEEEGFLKPELVHWGGSHPRKYFHLTKLGRATLRRWISTPVHRTRDFRQEFLAKIIVARRYGKPKALELIHIQEEACQTWLEQLVPKVIPSTLEMVDEALVYSFRASQIKGILQWLKECAEEIEKLPDPYQTK
jgi:PadR family transcriptional regulator, regulatory protein AphA